MSTVLRAYGTDFDVDAFLVECRLPICAVKRRGDPVAPRSRPNGRRHDRSGIHVSVSDADFDDFPRQLDETTMFLQKENDQMLRLCAFPGIEDITIDFGVDRRDAPLACYSLPPDLIRISGSLGLGIELSLYSCISKSSGSDTDEQPADC